MSVTRRTFIKSIGIGSLGAIGGLTGLAYAESSGGKVKLEAVDIPVHKLPREFAGYKILFLSDLHLANCLPEDSVLSALDMARQCRPDLVLLGGDYVWVPDHSYSSMLLSMRNMEICPLEGSLEAESLYARLAGYLRSMRAPDGVLAVMGNHDNWIGRRPCMRELAGAGVNLLVNSHAIVRRGSARLLIFGADDYMTGIPADLPFGQGEDGSNVRILLAHNPDYWSHLLSRAGRSLKFDLGLAGHTHGGQIKVPGLGALYTGIRDRRFDEGLIAISGAQFYTTRGVGVVGVPIRINCPPEATLLTLLRA